MIAITGITFTNFTIKDRTDLPELYVRRMTDNIFPFFILENEVSTFGFCECSNSCCTIFPCCVIGLANNQIIIFHWIFFCLISNKASSLSLIALIMVSCFSTVFSSRSICWTIWEWILFLSSKNRILSLSYFSITTSYLSRNRLASSLACLLIFSICFVFWSYSQNSKPAVIPSDP